MKYPDGQEIQVGDLIWWNGGDATGYVQSMLESEEEFRAWELDEPHLFLENHHPFDPTSLAGLGYPQSVLADDGIRLFTEEEKQRLDAATVEASRLTGIDFSTVPHGVGVESTDDGASEWVFAVIQGEELKESVRVPCSGLRSSPEFS